MCAPSLVVVALLDHGCCGWLSQAQVWQQQNQGGGFKSASPALLLQIDVIAMSRSNWVMAYSSQANRSQRFDESERRWVELQENLNRWG